MNAAALILVHDHPSGEPSPSRSDIDMTNRIRDAAKLIDVALHDHIVVTPTDAFSFRENGLLYLRIRQRTRIDTVLRVMTDRIVIAEKSSQAKDVRAAVGSRHGTVLAAEGHPRGAAHGGTGLTRHRLQPPGSAHRPGDALPLLQ